MFSLDPIHPVYSAIVELVAVYPQSTIGELHTSLKKKLKVDISLAHLYRVVTRMVERQILIKNHGKLSLNLMWISYIEFIAGRAKRIMQHTDEFPLREGEKKIYDANSLFDVEAVWNHALVSLYRLSQEKTLYKYYSHAWWQLGRSAEEMSFYKQLKERGIDCHWVFGSTSPMDKIGAKRITEVFPAVVTHNPPFPKEGYCVNIYGDYIIECIFPEKMSRHFSMFFDSIKTMKEFDEELFADIFTMRAKYKVTVWRNAQQAKLMKAKLAFFFKN